MSLYYESQPSALSFFLEIHTAKCSLYERCMLVDISGFIKLWHQTKFDNTITDTEVNGNGQWKTIYMVTYFILNHIKMYSN